MILHRIVHLVLQSDDRETNQVDSLQREEGLAFYKMQTKPSSTPLVQCHYTEGCGLCGKKLR